MVTRHIRIFDTTLRDGQQCPGAGMSYERNLEYAHLARELNVDVLEAGFPSASLLDFQIVNTIAKEFSRYENAPIVAALCQMRHEQVERTVEALLPVKANGKALLHVYLPVDPILMPASLGERANDKKQLIKELYECVNIAASAGLNVEFSPEGYSRMRENFDFVTELIRAAIEAGATVINCPDTIGGASILQGEEYFVNKLNRHAEIFRKEYPDKNIIWSVHCHNDFGLAVQNSINGIFDGPASQIEGCINGIGERAGNASLEQCIMIIKNFANCRKTSNGEEVSTSVRTEHLQKISDFVGKHMLPRQPHSPVCGDNAAKHSSGGHTNAVLKNPLSYQPFDPREIGKEISFAFGPLSGGNHAKSIIEQSGYRCPDDEKAMIAQFIKNRFSQRRKGITDDELMQAYFEFHQPVTITQIDYSKTGNKAVLQFTGKFFSDEEVTLTETNEGQDSALAALKRLLERKFGPFEIQSHRSYSDSEGINASSVSQIFILDEFKREFEGRGSDQDIELSAMKALIDAVNQGYVERLYRRTLAINPKLATV